MLYYGLSCRYDNLRLLRLGSMIVNAVPLALYGSGSLAPLVGFISCLVLKPKEGLNHGSVLVGFIYIYYVLIIELCKSHDSKLNWE